MVHKDGYIRFVFDHPPTVGEAMKQEYRGKNVVISLMTIVFLSGASGAAFAVEDKISETKPAPSTTVAKPTPPTPAVTPKPKASSFKPAAATPAKVAVAKTETSKKGKGPEAKSSVSTPLAVGAVAAVATKAAVMAKTETPKDQTKPEPETKEPTAALKEEKVQAQPEQAAPSAPDAVKLTQDTNGVKASVLKVLKDHEELSTFAEFVSDAGLESEFAKAGADLTVFAPTNKAMKSIPSAVREKIDDDKKNLVHFVKYHCVAGAIPSGTMIRRQASVATMVGESIGFKGNGESIAIENGHIVRADLKGTNGVVHVIDTPMVPASYMQKEAPAERQPMSMRRMGDERLEAKEKVTAPQVVKPEGPKAPEAPKSPTEKQPEQKGLLKKLFGF